MKVKYVVAFVAFLSVFVVEHLLRTRQYDIIRPSQLLSAIATFLRGVCYAIGRFVAQISNVSEALRKICNLIPWDELSKTTRDLLIPFADIFLSPLQSIVGYLEALKTMDFQIGVFTVTAAFLTFSLYAIKTGKVKRGWNIIYQKYY